MESQRTYKSHFGIGPSSVVMVNTKQLNVTFVDLLSFLNLMLLHSGFWKSYWYFVYYGFSFYVFMCFVLCVFYGYVSVCMIFFKLSFFGFSS